ncbi:MAG: hypothetical protein OSA40_08930 [Phycisphaerales bacterium]|nr:hypothetical protein [Phycisphaerales bacterium]
MASDVRQSQLRSRWKALGPGLIFAGAAVGVSHVVQSTRGGAEMGTAAVLIVVASCLIKFPAFRFGPFYAAVTGDSLLAGYRRQGLWVLVIFAVLTLAILFTTLAAVTVVSAGLLLNLVPPIGEGLRALGLEASSEQAAVMSALLLALTAILIGSGGYRLLEGLMKVVMPLLMIGTIIATGLAIRQMTVAEFTILPPISTGADRNLLAAMVGWMPAPIDIAVWSSLWTLARARGRRMDRQAVLGDFDAGFLATLVLAILFVLLGAAVMHRSDVEFSASSVEFCGQVIELYTSNLGAWSQPLIASVAFLAMLSTTVTVADGFPRTVAALVRQFRLIGLPSSSAMKKKAVSSAGSVGGSRVDTGSRTVYGIVFAIGSVGATLILWFGLAPENGITFTELVDVVTITSFLAAPLLAFFNHRCVFSSEIPVGDRPTRLWWVWSWIGIVVLGGFAVAYTVGRLVG